MLFFLKTLKPKPFKFMTIYCEKVPSPSPLTEILWQKLLFLLSCARVPQFRKRSYRLFIIPLFAFGNKVFPLVNYAVFYFSLLPLLFFFLSRTRKSAYLGRIWKIKRIGQQSGVHRKVETVWRWNIRPTFLVIKRRRTTSINERT